MSLGARRRAERTLSTLRAHITTRDADLRLYRQWEHHGGSAWRLAGLLLLSSSAQWMCIALLHTPVVARWGVPAMVLAAVQTVRGRTAIFLREPSPLSSPPRLKRPMPPPYPCAVQLRSNGRTCARVMASPGIEQPMAELHRLLTLAQ